MSREADYLVFATELYRYAKGLSGAEVIELFSRYDVDQYILDMFELFHIECEANMIAAVDEYLAQKGYCPEPSVRAESLSRE
ncbi:MAG: DUF3791 domain-containing protein [bacterium]|nr:DUF3791 domain-containing protein [bacterium]